MSTQRYPNLFSPLTLAGKTLRNRVCMTATLSNFGTGSRVTEAWKNFLIERARGGAALIITEAVAVDENAIAHPAVVAAFADENQPEFQATADAIHKAGGLVVAQLWHAGRQQLWHPTRSPQGVSDQPDAYSWSVPHVMNDAEINRVINSFVDVAQKFKAAGFDGVELHGAHGYLITQFLSPWSNTRDDDWGGSLEKRCRFCLEIAKRIRSTCGNDFILGLKLPADEGVEGGIDVVEAGAITRYLKSQIDFDYLEYSQGNFSRSLENHVPDMHFAPGHFIDLHKTLRESAGDTPVMAVGRIGTGELAEKVVSEGYADLVGMSRALLVDADLPNKLKQGNEEDIRPCLYDNYSWGVIHTGKPMIEAHNPQLATDGESGWTPSVAEDPRTVVVAGAGPAGLEAAWVAAARGHSVTLFSGSAHLGGSVRLESALPGHEIVGEMVEWQQRRCKRHGVEVRTGVPATAASVAAIKPDAVIVATGATMRPPEALETGRDRAISVRELAASLASGKMAPDGRTAVLYDHDHSAPVYAAALALAQTHDRVILVTPRTEICQVVNHCSKLGINRRLYSAGIDVRIATEPVAWDEDRVSLKNVFSGHIEPAHNVDTLVYATPRQANDKLVSELGNGASGEIHVIGDCQSPRNLMIAIHEAHAIAGSI